MQTQIETAPTLLPFDTSMLSHGESAEIVSIYAYCQGIKKRARKIDHHQIKVGQYYAHTFTDNLSSSLEEAKLAAKNAIASCMRQTFGARASLVASYQKVEKIDGFISTEMRVFDDRNFNLSIEL